MEHETIFNIALFSGILGFVVYCLSYTYHVWKNRNTAISRQNVTRLSRSGWAMRLFGVLFVVGCLLLIVVPIVRELPTREGLLSGDGLFTIRADDQLRLEYVTDRTTVATGDVLAQFRSPDHQARIKELTLKRQILSAQKEIIQHQALCPDHELIRRYQQADADRRQLFASWLHLIPERAVVAREKLRDELDRTERINHLDTEIAQAQWRLERSAAQLERSRRHAAWYTTLAQKDAATQLECDDRNTDVTMLAAEVAGLETSIENYKHEKETIAAGLPQYQAITQQQLTQLDHEAEQTHQNIASTAAAQQTIAAELDQDLERARRLRQVQLEQLDLEIQQCDASLEGLQGTLTIQAPFPGHVEFTDPAPQTALAQEPVVVLSPAEGFRLSLRLPESEISALAATDEVILALSNPSLQRRFPGRLLESQPLPYEPGYALAQLTCQPPTETIHELTSAQDASIKVRLVWRPPLYAIPLFWPAVSLIALGACGWSLLTLTQNRKQRVDEPSEDLVLAATQDASALGVPADQRPAINDPTYKPSPWRKPAAMHFSGSLEAE